MSITDPYQVHSTAIVDSPCRIGEGTRIWHWSHISQGCEIGERCSLGQNVYVAGNTRIGNNVKIQNNVSIYDNIIIEDDVFCGPSMVFTNVVNPRSEFPRKDQYAPTLIKKGTTIGANATVVCGITLGEYAFVAAGAVVTKDVLPYQLIAGVPGKPIGWMSRFGERMSFSAPDDIFHCPHTQERYQLIDGVCQRL